MRQDTQISRTLHIAMATENVGATARRAHVPQRELEYAIGASIVVTVGVLRATHTPDHRTRTVVGQCTSNAAQLAARCSGYALNFLGCPFRNFLTNLIHAPNAGTDKLFVLPTVFEDMPQNTPYERYVAPWPEPHIFVSVSGRSGKARIANYQRRVILLFGFQNMQ